MKELVDEGIFAVGLRGLVVMEGGNVDDPLAEFLSGESVPGVDFVDQAAQFVEQGIVDFVEQGFHAACLQYKITVFFRC